MQGGPETGRIVYRDITLMNLLLQAFAARRHEIYGPEWLEGKRVDVTATFPRGIGEGQFRSMLRNLLTEQFKLESHWETRELRGYSLVQTNGGPKFKLADEVSPAVSTAPVPSVPIFRRAVDADGFPETSHAAGIHLTSHASQRRWRGVSVTIGELTERLSFTLNRSVINNTGLTGRYDFTLTFDTFKGGIADAGFFAALASQLGLKLESRKVPVAVVVIDRMESSPIGKLIGISCCFTAARKGL